jgi:DNA ligase 1
MFLPPMLLEKVESPFDDDNYIFEPKIDGHRLILSVQNGEVRLYTRHNNDVTRQYPELHAMPIDDHSDTVLDGEVACINPETGSIDFEMVMERFQIKKPFKIQETAIRQPVHFFAFDILRYKGKDLRSLPLMERKAILAQALSGNPYFSTVLSVEGAGNSLFKVIKQKKLEGIVAKKRTSKYVGRRHSNWLKIINYQYAEVLIVGYRKGEFGWLLQHDDKAVGILELSVPAAHKKAFYRVSNGIITGEDKNFVYFQPHLRAKVRFRNWTRAGMLITPEFVEFVA